MEAVTEDGITPLYTGMPIWNTYFCDLTGDGIPDLCSTYTFGSGIIDSRIIIYDYANGVSYELSDRGYFDFTLRQDEQDGRLYVYKTKYNSDELVETGRLVFKNNCIQVEGFSNEAHQVFRAEILEIHDGYYLVKPVEGSWELSSADRIEVPIRNAHTSPEPEVGDVIEIEYSGEILETYPARIADVYGIKVVEETDKFYLTIGAEGVKSIELSMPHSSGGCENADGSLFKKGERIWLENLDGYSDLRGLTITALGEDGEIIWTASVPDGEENKGFTHLVIDDWEITNIE